MLPHHLTHQLGKERGRELLAEADRARTVRAARRRSPSRAPRASAWFLTVGREHIDVVPPAAR